MVTEKFCPTCKEEKKSEEFNKSTRSSSGLGYQCRECSKKRFKLYRDKNQDRIKEKYQQNRDKRIQKNRKYRQENEEKLKAKRKKYYQENKELFRRRAKEQRSRSDYKQKKKEAYWKNVKREREQKRKDYLKHKEKRLEYSNTQYRENEEKREKVKARSRERYLNKKEEIRAQAKEYRQRDDVKKRKAVIDKAWREKNPDKVKASRKKHKNTPNGKLTNNLRGRLKLVMQLKNAEFQHPSMTKMVGCNKKTLLTCLESQFYDGTDGTKMTWDNYGAGNGYWQVDHIKPCFSFDLNDAEEQKKCFHYTNLQPIWFEDHVKKTNKDREIYTAKTNNSLQCS